MKLSRNSWHCRIYDITYPNNPPNNLCPYFWKVVLATILFIPYTILYIPVIITRRIFDRKYFTWPSFVEETPLALCSWLGIVMVYCMGAMFWHVPKHSKDSETSLLFLFGSMGWGLTAIVLVMVLIEYIKDIREGRRALKEHNRRYNEALAQQEPPKVKKVNLIKALIKAKLDKNCPRIDWE